MYYTHLNAFFLSRAFVVTKTSTAACYVEDVSLENTYLRNPKKNIKGYKYEHEEVDHELLISMHVNPITNKFPFAKFQLRTQLWPLKSHFLSIHTNILSRGYSIKC